MRGGRWNEALQRRGSYEFMRGTEITGQEPSWIYLQTIEPFTDASLGQSGAVVLFEAHSPVFPRNSAGPSRLPAGDGALPGLLRPYIDVPYYA